MNTENKEIIDVTLRDVIGKVTSLTDEEEFANLVSHMRKGDQLNYFKFP